MRWFFSRVRHLIHCMYVPPGASWSGNIVLSWSGGPNKCRRNWSVSFTIFWYSILLHMWSNFPFSCLKWICTNQEADRKILAAMLEGEQEDRRMETTRRERAIADAAWMKRVIEEQLQLEQEREAEFDVLHRWAPGFAKSWPCRYGLLLLLRYKPMYLNYFREEAQRVWEKREAQWEKERNARERLMQEVKQASNQTSALQRIWQLKENSPFVFTERCSWGDSSSWSWKCRRIARLRRSPWSDENSWSRGWSRRGRPGAGKKSKRRVAGQHGCKR